MRTATIATTVVMLLSVLLTSCVGGRTEAAPDKHPDAWERKMARHNARH